MISIAIHNFKKLNYSKDEIDILPENLPPRPWYLGGEWYQYAYGPYDDMIRFCKEFDLKMTFMILYRMYKINEIQLILQ